MASSFPEKPPKTFYLNEHHELPVDEKSGGGRAPQYDGINWAAKGKRLSQSLEKAKESALKSKDPLRGRQYFLVAAPEPKLRKASKNKKKAPTGTFEEETDYRTSHPRVFSRLGLDLIDVTDDGKALVHATPERLEVLLTRTTGLDTLNTRDQSRWATVNSFSEIPIELRVDGNWLSEISRSRELVEAVFELQPFLSRTEVEDVLRGLTELLGRDERSRLTGTGQDYSGRCWFRGRVSAAAIRSVAKEFFSVQSIHDPLFSIAAAKRGRSIRVETDSVSISVRTASQTIPTVAVLDTGVSDSHPQLSQFRRGTQLVAPNVMQTGTHGTYVASRVVFGDVDWQEIQDGAVTASCQYLSANVSEFSASGQIYDKAVLPMLQTLRIAYPDVRVFNLSFSNRESLEEISEVKRREYLRPKSDLDNFVFANDVLIVASAGNSFLGVSPDKRYPDHIEEPAWKMNSWVAGFNVLVCGSYVSQLHPTGLVKDIGSPSPFTRIGPGIADSSQPDFCAPGGNWDDNYRFAPGLGVLAMNPQGQWEDQSGTSLATPILAWEAAITLQQLSQTACQVGSSPFAVTVRAFLTLTAERPDRGERIKPLADRTLGYGRASSNRLLRPRSSSVVMIWQGEIAGPKDLVRVQIPIPVQWLKDCSEPRLRMVVCWDPPVNNAISGIWACRHVNVHLRLDAESRGLNPVRRPSHHSYPVLDRLWHLDRIPNDQTVQSDEWLIDLSYDEIAEYYPGMDFTASQRVGVAMELFDAAEDAPVSPQQYVQALKISSTMTHLSAIKTPVRQPVVIRNAAN